MGFIGTENYAFILLFYKGITQFTKLLRETTTAIFLQEKVPLSVSTLQSLNKLLLHEEVLNKCSSMSRSGELGISAILPATTKSIPIPQRKFRAALRGVGQRLSNSPTTSSFTTKLLTSHFLLLRSLAFRAILLLKTPDFREILKK